MSIRHTIDREACRVQFEVSGTLTSVEMCSAIDKAVSDLAGMHAREVLSDHRGLDVPATSAQVHVVAAYLDRHADTFAGAHCAMVTASPASYGMMRMLGALVESIPIRVEVFTDINAARAWLEATTHGNQLS